ncbi:MAG: hypothetical protein OXC37_05720 [Bdellovibrionaceae bacterium]|nr:hypothetical protein [Pseudobdellovibrionaceae bacterium]
MKERLKEINNRLKEIKEEREKSYYDTSLDRAVEKAKKRNSLEKERQALDKEKKEIEHRSY